MHNFIHLSGQLAHHFFTYSLHLPIVNAFSMDLSSQLHITQHDCHLPHVYGIQAGILRQNYEVCLCCLLQSHEGCCLLMHAMPSKGVLQDLPLTSLQITGKYWLQAKWNKVLLITQSKHNRQILITSKMKQSLTFIQSKCNRQILITHKTIQSTHYSKSQKTLKERNKNSYSLLTPSKYILINRSDEFL